MKVPYGMRRKAGTRPWLLLVTSGVRWRGKAGVRDLHNGEKRIVEELPGPDKSERTGRLRRERRPGRESSLRHAAFRPPPTSPRRSIITKRSRCLTGKRRMKDARRGSGRHGCRFSPRIYEGQASSTPCFSRALWNSSRLAWSFLVWRGVFFRWEQNAIRAPADSPMFHSTG